MSTDATAAASAAVPESFFGRMLDNIRGGTLGSWPVLIGLAVIVIFFSFKAENFLSPGNFSNIITQMAGTTLLAYGVVFVLLIGEIDLSISYISGIAGVVVAKLTVPDGNEVAGIVAILVALWSANGGMKALIEALNIAWFETEKRGFIKLNLLSLALTLSAIVGVIVMIGLVAILPVLMRTLLAGSRIEGILNWLRWPLLAGMLILGLAVIYRFGPSKDNPKWQWISPGAVLATLGLLIASILFSWYTANFANYNETYGSLGAAVATMMWLWIAAIVVLMGAEVNSEVERQIKIENGVAPKSREDLDRA